MQYTYTPKETCSKKMIIDINEDNETINSVKIIGGCPGNTVGVSKLVEGRKIKDVINMLKDIPCGLKGTSCPDQLSKALEEIVKNIG